MSFNPMMARAAYQAALRLKPGPDTWSVVELGNQTYRGRNAVPNTKDIETTKQFYERHGFGRYLAIDVNTRMDAVVMDLNVDLEANYGFRETFDLVTNNGTGEHIFDQRAVFTNIHNLCKVGGLMLHVMPMTGWLNHGFYNFNPILYRDVAKANAYTFEFFWIGETKGEQVELSPAADFEWLFIEKRNERLKALVQGRAWRVGNLAMAVCLRKTRDEDFYAPIQGKYEGAIETDDLKAQYL